MKDEQELVVWRARFSAPDICSRRIEELTAELERLQGGLNRTSATLFKSETALATERAAREQAEKDRDDAVKACDDNWVTHQRIVQAERERDTALAREKTAERLLGEERLAKVAVETALASERARADGYYTAWNEDVRALKAAETAMASALALSTERYQELCKQAQRAADAETALASAEARVKAPEWANGVPLCLETCPQHDGKRCRLMGMRPDRICEPAVQQMAAERKAAETALASALARMKEAQLQAIGQQSRRCASETALASARERLSVLEPAWNTLSEDARTAALEAAGNLVLTSRPAPVAVPRSESRCALLPTAGCLDAIDDPPGMNDRQAAVHHYKRAQAAETAMASARELLDQPVPLLTADGLLKRITDLRKLLSSHPAPVAADEVEMLSRALRDSCADSTKAIGDLKQLLARANCLLLCAHPIVARSRDQGLRRAIAYHLRDRDVGFEDTEPETHPAPVAGPADERIKAECDYCHKTTLCSTTPGTGAGGLECDPPCAEVLAHTRGLLRKAYVTASADSEETPRYRATCRACATPLDRTTGAPVAAPSLLAAARKVTQLWADLSSQELYGEALDELLQDDRQELEDAMQALRDAEAAPVKVLPPISESDEAIVGALMRRLLAGAR